jgi:hypothetical protein
MNTIVISTKNENFFYNNKKVAKKELEGIKRQSEKIGINPEIKIYKMPKIYSDWNTEQNEAFINALNNGIAKKIYL